MGKVLKFELFLFRHPQFIERESLRGMRLPFVALWWVKHGKANIVHILPAPKFNMAHLKMAPKMNRRFRLWKPSFWGEPATKLGESKHIETATRMGPQNLLSVVAPGPTKSKPCRRPPRLFFGKGRLVVGWPAVFPYPGSLGRPLISWCFWKDQLF